MRREYKRRIKQLDSQINYTVKRAMELSLKDCSSWDEYIDSKIKAFINMGIGPISRDVVSAELNHEVGKLVYNNMKLNKYKRNEQSKELQERAIENWQKKPENRYSGEIVEGTAIKINDPKLNRKVRLPKGRRLLHELRSKKEVQKRP